MSIEKKQIYPMEFWMAHSTAWRSSSQTQEEYCKHHGVNFPSFVYHHNKIASNTKKTKINFIETKSESFNPDNKSLGLQLILPNGIRIGIANDVNSKLLQSLLTFVGAYDAKAL